MDRFCALHRDRPPVVGIPVGEGAFVRLAGEAVFNRYQQPEPTGGKPKTCSSVPIRVEIAEMVVDLVRQFPGSLDDVEVVPTRDPNMGDVAAQTSGPVRDVGGVQKVVISPDE